MKYTRRDFIKIGGFAGFGVGLLSALSPNVHGQNLISPIGQVFEDTLSFYNSATFENLVGSEFVIYTKNSAFSAVLNNVNADSSLKNKNGGECFTLIFELSAENFSQNTYEMFHPSVGTFELFLVPGKSPKGATLGIAVINRI